VRPPTELDAKRSGHLVAQSERPGGSARPAGLVAWIACALVTALVIAAAVLFVENYSAGSALEDFGLAHALIALTYAVVGALVVTRRPDNPIGWLLCFIAVPSALACLADQYARYSLLTRPESLPAAAWVAWVGTWIWLFSFLTVPFLLLLFPEGRLLSPRWRWAVWWSGASLTAVIVLILLAPRNTVSEFATSGLVSKLPVTNPLFGDRFAEFIATYRLAPYVLSAASYLPALIGLLLRFQRSQGTERQQLKWFLFGGTLTMLGVLAPSAVFLAVTGIGIPIGAGIAILKHHLYDIDRLINRTLVYGLLTVLLGGAYALAVLLLGQLFGGIGGEPPSWAVAGATLAVAALFQPARRRIQDGVDRRFYRRRYDAAKTIEAFSARLREEVDLDTLSAELLTVVDQTVQPTRASVWLRPSVKELGRAGT
jgi:MFS family permease